MKNIFASFLLIVVLVLVLSAGVTIVGAIPLMLFDEAIGETITTLAHAAVA